MLDFNKENHAKNLPDVYKQSTDSNNYKILELERVTCISLREALQEINQILDLDNASGKTLDFYGERVGQPRGKATDEQYLIMIKSKIMQNLCNGSHKSIIDSICMTFNCEPSEVILKDDQNNTCAVVISSLPLNIINKAGLTTEQTVAMIKRLLPVGVTLTSFLFDGTFEFSDSESDYDETKGFSDDSGTIGGYLGVTQSDTTDEVLPI